jgi:nitrate reductase NapD
VELAGIIVRVFPKDLDAIRSQLTSLQGVEVHHATADGRLIVTIEQPTHRQLAANLTRIQDIDRLLSLSMVYQYSDESVGGRCESDDDADQSKSCQLEHSNAQETSP